MVMYLASYPVVFVDTEEVHEKPVEIVSRRTVIRIHTSYCSMAFDFMSS